VSAVLERRDGGGRAGIRNEEIESFHYHTPESFISLLPLSPLLHLCPSVVSTSLREKYETSVGEKCKREREKDRYSSRLHRRACERNMK
jgi:hypothetical protein